MFASPLQPRAWRQGSGTPVVFVMIAVILVLSTLAPLGCRRPGGSDGGTADQPGAPGEPETPPLPELLWFWPSESEAKAAPGSIAFFRFESPVTPGSLSCTVEPQTDATLAYAGEMVIVRLDQLLGPSRATLKDASGAETATAYLAAASPPRHTLPEVTASEGLDRASPGVYRPFAEPLADGALAMVGPGDVLVYLLVPVNVTEETLRAGLELEPETPASLAFTTNWSDGGDPTTCNVLTVRWPGLPVTGHQLPDPLKVAGTSSAPAGFALKMSLVVDAGKVPAFAQLAGPDGVYRLEIERTTAPDYTARSLDVEAVTFPYRGFRTIYHLPPGPHRFRLEFATPMNRASVERRLVGYGWGANPKPPAWEFRWQDDQTLDVTVRPPGELFTLDIYPAGAMDQRGLFLWSAEELTVAWCPPQSVVRVPASDSEAQGEVVTAAPPGVIPQAMPAGASRLLGYETPDPGPYGEGSVGSHPWVFEQSSGRWSDWAEGTPPWPDAVWLDDGRLFVNRYTGWEIYDAATGKRTQRVDLESSADRLLGLTPDPAAKRVAVLSSASPRAYGSGLGPVDLSILGVDGNPAADPAGQPVQPLTAVTAYGDDDFYLYSIPTVWLDQETLVLVDRPEKGPTRLVQVDLASARVTALPDTEGASRWEAGLFTAFGSSPSYCTFATMDEQGNWRDFVLYDLADDEVVYRFGLFALKVGPAPTRCLPSPDGRYLAFSGEGRSFIWDLAAQAKAGSGGGSPVTPIGTEIGGTVVGWSADSEWIYLARATD